MMTITRRYVNVKRHTKGYLLNGNTKVSRGMAVRLARRNKIRDVVAKHGRDGWYISMLPWRGSNTLTNLNPIVVR